MSKLASRGISTSSLGPAVRESKKNRTTKKLYPRQYKPGDIVHLASGRRYIVQKDYSWKIIR